jgi:hypothetical protein
MWMSQMQNQRDADLMQAPLCSKHCGQRCAEGGWTRNLESHTGGLDRSRFVETVGVPELQKGFAKAARWDMGRLFLEHFWQEGTCKQGQNCPSLQRARNSSGAIKPFMVSALRWSALEMNVLLSRWQKFVADQAGMLSSLADVWVASGGSNFWNFMCDTVLWVCNNSTFFNANLKLVLKINDMQMMIRGKEISTVLQS